MPPYKFRRLGVKNYWSHQSTELKNSIFFHWSHNTFDVNCRSFCNWATAKFLESKKTQIFYAPNPLTSSNFFFNSFIKTTINHREWENKLKSKNLGLHFHPLLKYWNFSFFCNIYPISLLFNLPLWSFIIYW